MGEGGGQPLVEEIKKWWRWCTGGRFFQIGGDDQIFETLFSESNSSEHTNFT